MIKLQISFWCYDQRSWTYFESTYVQYICQLQETGTLIWRNYYCDAQLTACECAGVLFSLFFFVYFPLVVDVELRLCSWTLNYPEDTEQSVQTFIFINIHASASLLCQISMTFPQTRHWEHQLTCGRRNKIRCLNPANRLIYILSLYSYPFSILEGSCLARTFQEDTLLLMDSLTLVQSQRELYKRWSSSGFTPLYDHHKSILHTHFSCSSRRFYLLDCIFGSWLFTSKYDAAGTPQASVLDEQSAKDPMRWRLYNVYRKKGHIRSRTLDSAQSFKPCLHLQDVIFAPAVHDF